MQCISLYCTVWSQFYLQVEGSAVRTHPRRQQVQGGLVVEADVGQAAEYAAGALGPEVVRDLGNSLHDFLEYLDSNDCVDRGAPSQEDVGAAARFLLSGLWVPLYKLCDPPQVLA